MKGVCIAPSILSADFSRLGDEVSMLEAGGADWIHVDVMDGCFVPNLTFGAKVIETLRGLTSLPLDVHLMVVEPEKYFDEFVAAGASGLTIHAEAAPHLHRQLARIRELGATAGVALNPATPLTAVQDVLGELDLLLVMSVTQDTVAALHPHSVERIARARVMLDAAGSGAVLEVDGGINERHHRVLARRGHGLRRGQRGFARRSPGRGPRLRDQCLERVSPRHDGAWAVDDGAGVVLLSPHRSGPRPTSSETAVPGVGRLACAAFSAATIEG